MDAVLSEPVSARIFPTSGKSTEKKRASRQLLTPDAGHKRLRFLSAGNVETLNGNVGTGNRIRDRIREARRKSRVRGLLQSNTSEEGMSDRIDRKKLYDLVWSEPISTLAEKFGYSDVGLSKLCKRHGIPLPARGHWARIQAGQKLRQPPLPAAKAGQDGLALKPLPDAERHSRAAQKAQSAAVRHSISADAVVRDTEKLHPLARGARRRLRQKDSRVDPKQLRYAPKEVLDIEVTPGSIDRATSIASAVLVALEKLGATVLVDRDKGRTVLALMDTQLRIKISEHVARSDHQATVAEQRAVERDRNNIRWGSGTVEYPHIPRHDFTPTGLLTITASGWPHRSWRDTRRTPLEQRLGEVVAGILSLAEEVRDREQTEARKKAEHECKVQRYEREMARRTEERAAYRQLRLDAKRWVAANELRAYLRAVGSVAALHGTDSNELAEWIGWASRKADWLDPTVLVSDAILDAPQPEKPRSWYW
ncbi:hypothetical protein LF41_1726 [Lysobacter dokdonensis DS-58]|uniref:Uncharacterized protein n=2 Tax=Noviluteimonas TaxID=3382693 RepID=A0A0A2WGN9_9GAMM|nr:hypothetical protein LF41_1726 [Lysobacter dokdonensis DS-58]